MLTTQQPWAADRLARHAGKTLRIALDGFSVTMTIDGDGHLAQSDAAIIPDVVLRIAVEKLTFAPLLNPAMQQDMAELIHITGEAALAQVFSDLARDLRPDLEDALAKRIGDLPARKLMHGAGQVIQTLRTVSRSLSRNISEYLSEETDTLTGHGALSMHHQRMHPMDARLNHLSTLQSGLLQRIERLSIKRARA